MSIYIVWGLLLVLLFIFGNKIKNLKDKVKWLREDVQDIKSELVHKSIPFKKDFVSGMLYPEANMVKLDLIKEEPCGYRKCGFETETGFAFFLKGTEPKCDTVKIDVEGKLSYYKNNVGCLASGKIK